MASAATPSGSATSPDSNDSMLIVSGGEGYIDFRIGKTFDNSYYIEFDFFCCITMEFGN